MIKICFHLSFQAKKKKKKEWKKMDRLIWMRASNVRFSFVNSCVFSTWLFCLFTFGASSSLNNPHVLKLQRFFKAIASLITSKSNLKSKHNSVNFKVGKEKMSPSISISFSGLGLKYLVIQLNLFKMEAAQGLTLARTSLASMTHKSVKLKIIKKKMVLLTKIFIHDFIPKIIICLYKCYSTFTQEKKNSILTLVLLIK